MKAIFVKFGVASPEQMQQLSKYQDELSSFLVGKSVSLNQSFNFKGISLNVITVNPASGGVIDSETEIDVVLSSKPSPVKKQEQPVGIGRPEKAEATSRVLAYLIDLAIAIISSIIVVIIGSFIRIFFIFGLVAPAYLLLRDGIFPKFPGQGLGKKALKIMVVNAETGEPIKWLDSVKRQIFMLIPIVNIVEIILLFTDPDGRRLGDKVANTIVVKSRAKVSAIKWAAIKEKCNMKILGWVFASLYAAAIIILTVRGFFDAVITFLLGPSDLSLLINAIFKRGVAIIGFFASQTLFLFSSYKEKEPFKIAKQLTIIVFVASLFIYLLTFIVGGRLIRYVDRLVLLWVLGPGILLFFFSDKFKKVEGGFRRMPLKVSIGIIVAAVLIVLFSHLLGFRTIIWQKLVPEQHVESPQPMPKEPIPSESISPEPIPSGEELRASGRIEITSEPSGAAIYLDGAYVNTTPYTITNIKPGRYSLSIRKDGYYDSEHAADVSLTEPSHIHGALTNVAPSYIQAEPEETYSIEWYENTERAMIDAGNQHKPMMWFLAAHWCGYCKKMESETFTDSRVLALLKKFVCVRLYQEENPQLFEYTLRLEGFPTIIFYGRRNTELGKFIGYKNADDFALVLERMLSDNESL